MTRTRPSSAAVFAIALSCQTAPVLAQSASAPADSFTTRIEVPSRGDTLRGFIRVAEGEGPRLTVLLLQGFPGAETPKLPATMQAAGFNGVGFNFRGNRTSGGFFTVDGTIEDAKAMVAFLRSDSARRRWHVDPDRIALVGASSGTLSTLRTAADDPRIACVAVMVPFNWSVPGLAARTDPAVRSQFDLFLRNLTGRPNPPIRERGMVDRLIATADSLDLAPVGARLGGRKVMLVGAAEDQTAPLPQHFMPLVEAIRNAGGAGLRDTIVADSHNLPGTGDEVVAGIVRWLRSDCMR
jgi:pimeloyl-ACP methyl ester carboxylesterase